MYCDYYQFASAPFENTPDPRFFYASEQHREALAAIEYSIRMRKGIVLITGDIGAGKTTVVRTMLHRCGKDATIVQLNHGHRTAGEMLAHLLRSLGFEQTDETSHAMMLERLEAHLLQCAQAGRPVILFIDEAQTLSDVALEELRLISNFDTETFKLLQLVLIGQPELRERLSAPHMAPLRQRLVIARRIPPLACEETNAYIHHRMTIASICRDAVHARFDADATLRIHRFTGGIPRLINTVCDNCLLLGMVKQSPRITDAMVRRVIADMIPGLPAPTPLCQAA